MFKRHLILGSVLALLSVIFGAFGAHLFSRLLEQYSRTDTFDTAVQYHQLHALAILIIALLLRTTPDRRLSMVSYLFVLGILLFSGALYTLSLTGLSILGALAPLGGLCFIAGWILLTYTLIRIY